MFRNVKGNCPLYFFKAISCLSNRGSARLRCVFSVSNASFYGERVEVLRARRHDVIQMFAFIWSEAPCWGQESHKRGTFSDTPPEHTHTRTTRNQGPLCSLAKQNSEYVRTSLGFISSKTKSKWFQCPVRPRNYINPSPCHTRLQCACKIKGLISDIWHR